MRRQNEFVVLGGRPDFRRLLQTSFVLCFHCDLSDRASSAAVDGRE